MLQIPFGFSVLFRVVMDYRFSILPEEKLRFLKTARPVRVGPPPAEHIFPQQKHGV